jgi:ADP-heptose:LPS heptosyltransferase
MTLKRILFIAEGQLGDLLLLTPALRAARTAFNEASISVLIVQRRLGAKEAANIQRLRGPADSVLSTNPNVDELFEINRAALRGLRGLKRIRAELGIVKFLREKKYDAVVSTFPEDRFAFWAYVSGARIRVGQKNQGFSLLLTHAPEIEKHDRGVLEYYCDLVRALGALAIPARIEYNIPPSAHQWADEFLQRSNLASTLQLVAVHPGATGDYKVWPPDRFAELIDHLQLNRGARVALCHSPHDAPVVGEIRRLARTPFVEADTGENISHLAALLQRCSLCITNDSGPRHLAVAVHTPSLAFFRQFHDREWQIYPEERGTSILKSTQQCPVCPAGACLDRIPEGKRFGSYCLRLIEVGEAVAKAKEMLAFQRSK